MKRTIIAITLSLSIMGSVPVSAKVLNTRGSLATYHTCGLVTTDGNVWTVSRKLSKRHIYLVDFDTNGTRTKKDDKIISILRYVKTKNGITTWRRVKF